MEANPAPEKVNGVSPQNREALVLLLGAQFTEAIPHRAM